MMVHETTIEVKDKNPAQIYSFLTHMTKDIYLNWHEEHIDFQWIEKKNGIIGSRLLMKEKIKKWTISYVWKIVRLEKNQKISFQAESVYPLAFELELKSTQYGTTIIQKIKAGYFGFGSFFFNWIAEFFFFGKERKTEYRRHTVEEYLRLTNIC